MPLYGFKGREYRGGKLVTGEAEVRDERLLLRQLHERGVLPIEITEKTKESGLSLRLFERVSSRDLALFSRQFSVMLQAGLPMMRGLEILAEQQDKAGFRLVLERIRVDLESGYSLADSMRREPKIFGRLYTDMVAAGEVGGFLDLAFERLSLYVLRAFRLRSQIVTASLYPVVVLIAALATISVIMVWVIPVFVSLFRGLDAPLPLLTRIVISCSETAGRFGVSTCVLFVLTGVLFRLLYRYPKWQLAVDRQSLQVPLLGKLLLKISIARFAMTLGTLLRSGIPLLEGLEITASTTSNRFVRDSLIGLKKQVEGGKTVFSAMNEQGIFPPLVTGMVAVGEQAGELDHMLEQLAVFYEEEAEVGLKRVMTLLEPMLILVLGLVTGVIVIALYLPVFTLVGHLAG